MEPLRSPHGHAVISTMGTDQIRQALARDVLNQVLSRVELVPLAPFFICVLARLYAGFFRYVR